MLYFLLIKFVLKILLFTSKCKKTAILCTSNADRQPIGLSFFHCLDCQGVLSHLFNAFAQLLLVVVLLPLASLKPAGIILLGPGK